MFLAQLGIRYFPLLLQPSIRGKMPSATRISEAYLFKLVIAAVFLASRASTSESRVVGASLLVQPWCSAGRSTRISRQQFFGLLRSTNSYLRLRGGGGGGAMVADVTCAPSVVSKDCVVVVMRGTPENSECQASTKVISALQKEVGG
jgi:hypothetical protein